MPKNAQSRTQRSVIVTQRLERLPRKIFEKKYKKIIQSIGNKPGIYALYDGKELYYVGRTSDLARRVSYHLKDQHSALWTHFSVYVTKKVQYTNDIEDVIISIAQPKGNKRLKLGKETKLTNVIKKTLHENYQKDLREFGLVKNKPKKEQTKRLELKGYFKKNRPLRKSYKGEKYKATLLKSGKIKYNNTIYSSPTSAAQAIVQKKSPNSKRSGWEFWEVKIHENNWVKLSDLNEKF